MKLNPVPFGSACALSFASIWILCSLLVVLIPTPMMQMGGHMIHTDLNMMSWTMTFFGFVIGLIAWSLWAGVTGWLIAIIYNRLGGG